MLEKKHDFDCGAVSFDVTAAKEKGGQTNANNLSKNFQKASKNSQSDLENDSTSEAPGLLPLPVIPKEIPLVSFVKPGLLPTPDIGLSLYSCELQKTENQQPVLLISQQGISDQEKKLKKTSINVSDLENKEYTASRRCILVLLMTSRILMLYVLYFWRTLYELNQLIIAFNFFVSYCHVDFQSMAYLSNKNGSELSTQQWLIKKFLKWHDVQLIARN